MVADRATEAGLTVARIHEIGPNYARTLQDWAAALAANKDAAIAAQSPEVYDRYDKYLNSCVKLVRDGYPSVHQCTLQKSPAGSRRCERGNERDHHDEQ